MKRNRQRLFSVTASDCKWEAYRGSGKGGQKKNKTSSAIRCKHESSGAIGEAEDHREQSANRKLAFRRMSESKEFRAWVKMKVDALDGKIEIEQQDETGKFITRKLRMNEV